MALRIVWKGYDPFASRFVIYWNTVGPIYSHERPWNSNLQMLLALLAPEFAWAYHTYGSEPFENRLLGKTVDEHHKHVIERVEAIWIPEDAERKAADAAKALQQEIPKIERCISEIWDKISSGMSAKTVYAFAAAVPKDGVEGTALKNTVIVAFGPDVWEDYKRAREAGTIVLIHETLHALLEDSKLQKILKDIQRLTKLPAEEALVQTLTNLVLWRAGTTDEMFAHYYDKSWKELCELEDKMREIIREWWLNGGDLRKMMEGRLLR